MPSRMDSSRRVGGRGIFLLSMALAGCAARLAPPILPSTPRMTAQPAPQIPGRRVSTLLDFESEVDRAFIAPTSSGAATIDRSIAHTGAQSLALSPAASPLTIKLPTLLEGRPFPADWTLLGAYLRCDEPAQVTLSAAADGSMLARTVALLPGVWTPVMIDLAQIAGAQISSIGPLQLQFAAPRGGIVHVDDLMLIDNHETVIDATGRTLAWSVKRRGLNYVIASDRFSIALPTAHAQQGGWSVVEASPARVRFASTASPGSMTIYPDGRMYWGGEFKPASSDLPDGEALGAQHVSPGEASIPAGMGRVNRSTAGDEDNDGYNETRGAYQVVASSGRLEVTIAPRSAALVRPILEIVGLPPGTPRVTMEGKLIGDVVQLEDGTVLVELPGRLQRPTLVNASVR